MRIIILLTAVASFLVGGCMPNVDFSQIQKPLAPAEMVNYKDFIGSWTWEAERLSAEGEPLETWTGSAQWDWALGGTYLHGTMTSTGPDKSFSSEGFWGWHPGRNTYVWWLLNDWGFPQEGTARYDATNKLWTMTYTGVGLDGTNSYGRYTMRVADANTLEWTMSEWADWSQMIKKIEMRGSYKRR